MTDDPFVTFVVEALNLAHPRFALADGPPYTPADADSPAAARKERERSFVRELYHQFRHLWDRAVPVQLGLGHVVVRSDPELPAARGPDFLFWQLGERGLPDRRLGAVSVTFGSNPDAVTADAERLARATAVGYPHAVSVVLGDARSAPMGVTVIGFDTERWAARVIEPG